jgi:hypothetical protein
MTYYGANVVVVVVDVVDVVVVVEHDPIILAVDAPTVKKSEAK